MPAKPIIISIIILSLVLSPFSLALNSGDSYRAPAQNTIALQTNEAHALFGLAGVVHDPIHMVTHIGKFLRDNLVTAMIESLKQRALALLTDKALNFVRNQGGLPRIVTNWNKDLGRAFDMAFNSFIEEIGMTELCSPIRMPTILMLQQQRQKFSIQTRAQCTLDRVVGNIDNFMRDFSRGGFVGYTTMLSNPYNNPLMAPLLILDEAERLSTQAAEDKEAQNISASGFQPTRRCDRWRIMTVGSGDNVRQINYEDEWNEDMPGWEQYCDEVVDTTPGQVTADQTADALDSTTKYIAGVQVAEAVAGIILNFVIDSFTSKLFDAGIDGLLGAGSSGFFEAEPCAGLSGESLLVCQVNEGEFDEAKQITLQRINAAIADAQQTLAVLQDLLQCERDKCFCEFNPLSCEPTTSSMVICSANTPRFNETRQRLSHTQSDINRLTDARRMIEDASTSQQVLEAYFTVRALDYSGNLSRAQTDLQQCQEDLQRLQQGG